MVSTCIPGYSKKICKISPNTMVFNTPREKFRLSRIWSEPDVISTVTHLNYLNRIVLFPLVEEEGKIIEKLA